jgi:hypothetical protein
MDSEQSDSRNRRMERGVIFVLALLSIAAHYAGLFEHVQRIGFAGRWNDLGVVLLGAGAICIFAWMRLGEWRKSNSLLAGVWKLYVILFLGVGCAGLGVWLSEARLVWMGCGWILALGLGVLLGVGAGAMLRIGLLLGLVPLLPWAWEWRIHSVGQAFSSWFAGVILDFVRVFFYWRGNAIGLVDREVLGNVQASGVRWFSPVFLAVMGYGFALRHGWFRSLYLACQTVFWVVIVQGACIAYSLWKLNGSSEQSEVVWGGWLDGVGILSVLFLVWSSDQFYSAFTFREADESQSGSQERVRGGATVGATWGLVVGVLVFAVVGGLGLYLGRWRPIQGWSEAGVMAPGGEWKGRTLTEVEEAEGFEPVFAQGWPWLQRRWRVGDAVKEEGTEGRLQVQEEVVVRVLGPWQVLPEATWLWEWYGWKVAEVRREGDLTRWTMDRTIAEEGFVVSQWVAQGEGGMKVQWILEVRGVRPVSEKRQEDYMEWFKGLVESVRVGSRVE